MYSYEKEREKIFTDEGQVDFLRVRDRVKELLEIAGAFKITKVWNVISCGDTWEMMAYVDRLVELGEIREVSQPGCSGQDRIFVKA